MFFTIVTTRNSSWTLLQLIKNNAYILATTHKYKIRIKSKFKNNAQERVNKRWDWSTYIIHVLLHSCITVEREGLWLWLSLWLYTFFCSSEFDRRPPLHNQSQKKSNTYISAPTSLRTLPHYHPEITQISLALHYYYDISKRNECNWIQLKSSEI